MILRTLTFKELVRHFENSGTPEQKETMKLLFGALGGHFNDDVENMAKIFETANCFGGIEEMVDTIRKLDEEVHDLVCDVNQLRNEKNELENENDELNKTIQELENQVRSLS